MKSKNPPEAGEREWDLRGLLVRPSGDFEHIVMSNCTFGCDELYGRGLVGVDPEGAIISSANLEPGSIPHEYAMTQLDTRVVSRSITSTNSRKYFAAHFEAEFRRAEE
jgi:hypothetical protein